MSKYSTKQKNAILNVLINENVEFKIKDIYEKLNCKVGLSTIYRVIEDLYNSGFIRKTETKSGCTYYHYSNCNNFYLRCNNCGIIVPIDCNHADKLIDHIYKEHGFKIDKNSFLLKGMCKKCEELTNETII